MTTTTQYTDPNPFSAEDETEVFGETFRRLITEAAEAADPEVDAQMAWDCLAFAAAAFVRNSGGGFDSIEVTRTIYMLLASEMFGRMVAIAESDEDTESDEG